MTGIENVGMSGVRSASIGPINGGRVIMGGLAAGLVINISEMILNLWALGQPMAEAMKAHNLPEFSGGSIALFMVLGFVQGIVTVWLYAAARPRLGPGPKTALLIALAIWFLAYLFPGIVFDAMGLFSNGITAISVIWGLAEIALASLAGAWLYRE
jgi:hypothetical protein